MNNDLRKAYEDVKNIYERLNKKPSNISRIVHTNKWNIVFTEKNHLGMAFNFTGEHNIYNEDIDIEQIKKLKNYIGKDIYSLVEYLLSFDNIQMRSFCLASINALSQSIMGEKDLEYRNIELLPNNDFEFINEDDVVTLVGYGGVVDKIKGRCNEFNVLDMRPDSSMKTLVIDESIRHEPEDINFNNGKDNGHILERTDILIMTGCTLVNGTFKELISKAKTARVIGIFGPSGQIIPEYLFDEGFNYIISNRINNIDGFYENIINPMGKSNKFSNYSIPYSISRV